MGEFNDEKKLVSQYNEAQLQILRLNTLWVECHAACKAGNLTRYKWLLDRSWIELSADAASSQKKKYYFDSITVLNKAVANSKNKDHLYDILQKKEIFLKFLQEGVGKGAKRKEEDSGFFD